MKICVIGAGYVGLVSSACFADLGNNVVCVDNDKKKISTLTNAQVPIFEPGLKELINKNYSSDRLKFTTNLKTAVESSDIIFICVGTPTSKRKKSANLKYVYQAANQISKFINKFKIIVTKSTVPVTTGDKIEKILSKKKKRKLFEVISNPEFLREGEAIRDFRFPDRIVVGSNNKTVTKKLKSLYEPLIKKGATFFATNRRGAELIKYASNAFLATKISYINEIANLCEAVGADVHKVASAMGQDGRISDKFLHPGPGFGGSCFPKDLEALLSISEDKNVKMKTVEAAIIANNNQKKKMVNKLINLFNGEIKNKKIAILGLAFKANTDDVRESSSINMINSLLIKGVSINAYDPIANNEMGKIINNINYFDNLYDAVNNVDGVVVMTEWNEFRSLDLKKIKSKMSGNIFLDTRNIISMDELSSIGFVYDNVGRIKK